MRFLGPGMNRSVFPAVPCPPECFTFEHRGSQFAFDPNTVRLAAIEPSELDGEEMSSFSAAYKPNFPAPRTRPWPGAFLFCLTQGCNMSCQYCFVSHDSERSRGQKTMSLETALAGLHQVLHRLPPGTKIPQINFSFFGGEPLLAFGLIKELVAVIETFMGSRPMHVTTNGTLITPEIAQFLEAHSFSTIVSLDGTEAGHNESRTFKNGNGSFQAVMAGLECLAEYAPSVVKKTTLRSTFTEENLHTETLRTRLEFLNGLVSRGLASHVSAEPVMLGESSCAGSVVRQLDVRYDVDEQAAFWEEQYNDAADWWLESFLAGGSTRFHHFNIYMKRIVEGSVHATECGAGRNYFSLNPDGTIYACHHEGTTKVGDAATGIDQGLASRWLENRYYARLKCPSCPIRNICGGGCRERSDSRGMGLAMPDASECASKRLFFKSVSWLLLKIPQDEGTQSRLRELLGIKCRGTETCRELP